MKLSSLRKIKALVFVLNNRPYEEKIELWFPHMYADGKWACDIVLTKFPESSTITPIVNLLNKEECNWWLSELNSDIAFHVQ